MFVDKAGTTSAILDDNDFYPWGGVVPRVGKSTSNNTLKFTGQYRDTESNLDYFGARYYASMNGRFMSPDWAAKPVSVPYAQFGDPQSLNLYSYVRNSPIVRADGDGHMIVGFSATGDPMYVRGAGVGGDPMADGANPYDEADRNALVITSIIIGGNSDGDVPENFGPPERIQQQSQNQQQQPTATVIVTFDKTMGVTYGSHSALYLSDTQDGAAL